MHFWIDFSSSVKNLFGVLIGIALNLWTTFGSITNIHSINSLNPGDWSVFHHLTSSLTSFSGCERFQCRDLLLPWLSLLLVTLFTYLFLELLWVEYFFFFLNKFIIDVHTNE